MIFRFKLDFNLCGAPYWQIFLKICFVNNSKANQGKQQAETTSVSEISVAAQQCCLPVVRASHFQLSVLFALTINVASPDNRQTALTTTSGQPLLVFKANSTVALLKIPFCSLNQIVCQIFIASPCNTFQYLHSTVSHMLTGS